MAAIQAGWIFFTDAFNPFMAEIKTKAYFLQTKIISLSWLNEIMFVLWCKNMKFILNLKTFQLRIEPFFISFNYLTGEM